MAHLPMIAVKVCAKNDTNGNPRRGWLIINAVGNTIDFVDEGYRGNGALNFAGYRGIVEGPSLDVTPAAYREFKRAGGK